MTAAGSLPITHEAWQQTIREAGEMLGYRVLHVRKSIGRGRRWTTTTSIVGWPDCLLYHPTRGGFVAIEAKVGKDKPTAEQVAVLAELEAAGARTMVAYPSDFDALVELLRHPPGRPQSD